jgi:hypothetical protein
MTAYVRVQAARKTRDVIVGTLAPMVDAGPGPGILTIYAGRQPANADEAVRLDPIWGNNTLLRATLSKPAFNAPVNGAISARPIAETEVLESGTASWARIADGNGNAVLDIDVGIMGASLNLGTTNRRTPEFDDAHVDAAVHEVEQRRLKEGREPCTFRRDPFHALQFRPHPSKPAGHPADGGGRHNQAMVVDRHGAGAGGLGNGPRS